MSTVIVEALVKNLSEGSVAFKYVKGNGSIRNAVGTLNLDLIPEAARPATTGSTEGNTIGYYDLESNGWRSFTRDGLIAAATA